MEKAEETHPYSTKIQSRKLYILTLKNGNEYVNEKNEIIKNAEDVLSRHIYGKATDKELQNAYKLLLALCEFTDHDQKPRELKKEIEKILFSALVE